MKIATPEQMKNIDMLSAEIGIPTLILMENAASAVVNELPEADSYLVVCGKGNNGGDGYAIARQLFTSGVNVSICCIEPPSGGDALINYEIAVKLSIPFVAINDFSEYDVIVDALLGTGLSSEVKGAYSDAIDNINASSSFVCSVDIPSGVDAKTGMAMANAVYADLTVTFGLPKLGLFFSDKTGELIVSPISIAQQVIDSQRIKTELISQDIVKLPSRSSAAHKGSCGKVLAIAGSTGMTGAAKLCCMAALKTGSGLVRLAIPSSLNNAMECMLTEAMTIPCNDEEGTFSPCAYDNISEYMNLSDVVIFGPGVSVSSGTSEFFKAVVTNCRAPLVLDADGLNLLALNKDLADSECIKVMTPHPLEFSRMSGYTVDEILSDRVGCASAYAVKHNAVIVLKGKGTVVAAPDGTSYINPTGNEGMATGGSGDVLAGMIASLIGQGLTPLESALTGVYLHGLAGDIAADELGIYSMIPTDIIEKIHTAIKEVEE